MAGNLSRLTNRLSRLPARCTAGPRLTAREVEQQIKRPIDVLNTRPLTRGEYDLIRQTWSRLNVPKKLSNFKRDNIFIANTERGFGASGMVTKVRDINACGRQTGKDNIIVFMRSDLYRSDYSGIRQPIESNGKTGVWQSLHVFRHEMAHVGQFQDVFDKSYARGRGRNYTVKVGNREVAAKNDYNWKPEINAGIPFNKLGPEDQAEYVADKTRQYWPKEPSQARANQIPAGMGWLRRGR